MEAAFADYSHMHTFPEPPIESCTKVSCQTEKGRFLKACRCNIGSAFSRVDDLKNERLRWHPDRFSRCPEQSRTLFRKAADEVFVIIDAIWQRTAPGAGSN